MSGFIVCPCLLEPVQQIQRHLWHATPCPPHAQRAQGLNARATILLPCCWSLQSGHHMRCGAQQQHCGASLMGGAPGRRSITMGSSNSHTRCGWPSGTSRAKCTCRPLGC